MGSREEPRRVGAAGLPPFQRVYHENVRDVYGFVAYRVRSREDAEDLTQETFERAARAWDRFDPARATPRTWLLVIARNLVIDHARASRPVKSLDEDDYDAGHHQGELELPQGLSPELSSAIGRLNQREQEVIALRFGGDMKGSEIAALMGLTLANVQQIHSRSLRRLRTELTEPSDEN